MNAIQEYALVFAVAIPIVLIAGINMFLVLTGERGTLLLPTPMPMPSNGPAPVDVQPARAAPPARPAKVAIWVPRSPISALRRFRLARAARPA